MQIQALYERPQIVDSALLKNRICIFASKALGLYDQIGWEDNPSRLFLPFSTFGTLAYDLPLFHEGDTTDDALEFQYDSLIHLFDHINFIYESHVLEFPETCLGPDVKTDGWSLLSRHRQENNPYCAEINEAVFFYPWPSHYTRHGW